MIFITAEIGTHWRGNFTILKHLARACKGMGCNAVKLQALDPEKLSRHPELVYYEDASVSPSNVTEINELMKEVGIEWYCTPTYPDAVEFLDDYVNIYKISVAGSMNNQLKDKVFSTGKKVIISTQKPFKKSDKRIINLYCVPKYPTSYGEINFNIMDRFDGFSNHCRNPMAILNAVEMGSKYIEFHITPSMDSFLIDNTVSFTVPESQDLVRWVRRYENWYNRTGEINLSQISK